MRRAPLIQLGLLALLLLWAYRLAHPPEQTATTAGEEIALWSIPAERVLRIAVTQPRSTVRLLPRADDGDGDAGLWVEAEVERPHPPREEPADGEPQSTLSAFSGNRRAQMAFDALRAPRATRRIGRLEELNAEDFGLAEPGGQVEVETAEDDSPRRMLLGGTTYGKTGRYVLMPDAEDNDGTVYLLPNDTFRNLARPERQLIERQLLPFPATDATRAELRTPGKTVTLWRLVESDPASQEWARDAAADEGEGAAQQWIRDLARLQADSYLEQGATSPATDDALLSVTLYRDGAPASTLHLLGELEADMLATSSFTRHPVRVNGDRARKLIENANTLLDSP